MRLPVPPVRTILAAAWLVAACASPGPEPVRLNEDPCDFCRMTISDSRFGGEAVTRAGRVYKFDSIECLVGWSRTVKADAVRALYVIDTQHPGTFVRADSAGFLKDGFMKSPMGKGLVAFPSPRAAEEQRAMLGGRVMSWAEVLVDTAPAAPMEMR
ncbi:MAG: nitrous oxide reductase accessory protein NosL [Gemmatimonadetes bacterium]|nr:nitrous oxide reductase accessory protein NosL [Gemmatimonadota bacterium]MBI3566693.1 nitrous oxide reductase accessory protein NosL [Gemmatimonadota bacterium]